MNLRPYQLKAADAVFDEWTRVRSTLVILPTGVGKTRVASEVIARAQPKRTLFLAHRKELIFQAQRQIKLATGLEAEIEMADRRASVSLFNRMPVVVSSIQTQISGNRMKRFNPDDFGIVICDESHRSTGASWKKVLEHYKQNENIKILGLTATPDRTDKMALGAVFDSVAYSYDLVQAIDDGWLVPIKQQMATIQGLDYSAVRTTAGDLNGADLASVLESERNLQEIVGASVKIIGTKKAIVFTASVRQAEQACAIFNRHRFGMASWVCGETPDGDRDVLLKDFVKNKTQVLVNVGVCVEGFDVPDIEVVIMARPTKSRLVYTQMVGRGTRTLAGTLDELHSSYERKQAIAESAKPEVVVLDFVGNSGRHKLISTLDILGGLYPEDVKALALAKIKASGESKGIKEALKESEEEIRARIEKSRLEEEARKARIVADVKYSLKTVNPFDLFDISPSGREMSDFGKELSLKQRHYVRLMGVDPDRIGYTDGSKLVKEFFRRSEAGLCTAKQANILKRFGYDVKRMSKHDASRAIDALIKNNWRRPTKIDASDIPREVMA